jgi:hypothetical protein
MAGMTRDDERLTWVGHATVLLDPAAASLLERADHYREVYLSKPDWQGL